MQVILRCYRAAVSAPRTDFYNLSRQFRIPPFGETSLYGCLLPIACWRSKSWGECVFDSWMGFVYFRILGKYPRCPVRGIENERETCLFKTRKRLQVIGAGGWTATTEENSARSVRDSHQHTHHGRSSWT